MVAKLILLAFNLVFIINSILSQERNQDTLARNQIQIKETREKLKIDGELTENIWNQVLPANNFWAVKPVDGKKAKHQTEVRLCFDQNNIYIAAILADESSTHVVKNLKRDAGFSHSDLFGVSIDPFNQKTNGYLFGVTTANVQMDDLLSSIAFNSLNFSWDSRWLSAVKIYPDKWVVEMAIPLKTFKYNNSNNVWGINFFRRDMGANEVDSWVEIPRSFSIYDIGFMGKLVWDDTVPKLGSTIILLPYVSGSAMQNNTQNETVKANASSGLDARLSLGTALNLDLTVNPDFSQIDVDQQVTNLTRFNIFFPERRTFFLENKDLFTTSASYNVAPFYSRTIGLDPNGNTIPILAGARLSGNLDKNFRIGIMNMQTARKNDYAAQNYSAFAINKKISKRSLLKGYFLNRQAFLTEAEKKINPLNSYGRNAGTEFNYINKNGSINATVGHHISMKPTVKNEATMTTATFNYIKSKFGVYLSYDRVRKNFYTDMGFASRLENYDAVRDSIIRHGFQSFVNYFEYTIFSKSKIINTHYFGLQSNFYLNSNGSLNESIHQLDYYLNLKNTSYFQFSLATKDTRLLFNTDFGVDKPLPPAKYVYNQVIASYNSDSRKLFYFNVGASLGKFYNADYKRYSTGFTYRKQPWVNFEIRFEYTKLAFPFPYGETTLFLIAPKIEISFSNTMFWTTFLQYNTQRNNFNVNSRFHWRYKPMSDIFLVYTDNYFTDPLFKNKNRAIVFKMNQWLNF